MLNQSNFVFILGAGASMDFGFPSGIGLFKDVVNKLSTASPQKTAVLQAVGDSDKLNSFVQDLRYSGMQSVDAFLEMRPDLIPIGKQAIAACLMPYENEDSLYNLNLKGKNWHDYLFQKMSGGARHLADFKANRVTFINYNYDRSFEYFLLNALHTVFPMEEAQLPSVLKDVSIIHLHGKLGSLPVMHEDNPIIYGSNVDADSVIKAGNAIKIVHEKIDDEPQFVEAHKALIKADNIFFLGFGFHETNLERLFLINTKVNTFYASSVGLHHTRLSYLRGMFARHDLWFNNESIQELLIQSGRLEGEPKSLFPQGDP